MSASRIVSGTAVDRVRPFTFEQPTHSRSPVPAATALHLEQEIERRSTELADQVREEARRNGFEQGATAARAEVDPLLEALSEATRLVGRSTEDTLDDLARSALVAGVAIAEAIVGKRLIDDPTVMVDPVRRAIQELDGDDQVEVHLNPIDAAILRQAIEDATPPDDKPSGSSAIATISKFRIRDDDSIQRGNCRVQSATRIAVDGIHKRLDDIRQAVESC